MKKTIALLFVLTCVGSVFADAESHKATAEKLVSLVAPKEVFMESFSAVFDSQVAQFKQMGIDQAKIDKIMAASKEFAKTIADDPTLNTEMVKLYQETYTEAEMKELLAFYKTPIGKKTLEVLPMLTKKSAMIGQQVSMKHQAAFQAKVQAIMMGQ